MLEILLQAAEYLEKQEAHTSNVNSAGYTSGDSSSSSSTKRYQPSITQIQKRSNTYHAKRLLSTSSPLKSDYSRLNKQVSTQSFNSKQLMATSFNAKKPFALFNDNTSNNFNKVDDIKRDKLIHNTLEKNRRAHLKECFENLQNELPQFKDKKVTNLAILNYTLKYIQQMLKKENDSEQEKVKQETRNEHLNDQLAKLRQELDAAKIDYTSFLQQQQQPMDIVEKNENEDEYVDDEGLDESEMYEDSHLAQLDEHEYDTSTSTASEIQVHIDSDQTQPALTIDEDDQDDYDYDTHHTPSQVHKFTLPIIKRTHKYSIASTTTADESTDSISSDLDNNNNLNNHKQQQQQQQVTQVINPLTAAAVKNYLLKQATNNNSNNNNNNNNTSNMSTTSGATSNLQLTREILQKALLNDKSQINIKHFHSQLKSASTQLQALTTPLQQQQQQQRSRSQRPATVNQLLTNTQVIKQETPIPTVILKSNSKQIVLNQGSQSSSKIYTVNTNSSN